jgi:hypothetical protein
MAGVRREGSTTDADRRRLLSLMGAGLVDSLFLSMAWTVVVLEVTAAHGLVAAGLLSTSMLVGVALSAPTAGWLSRRLDGRRLLRRAAAVEAVLRLSLFVLLVTGAGVLPIAGCVAAMNVVAWTGYAGMRAEVAAAGNGAAALTWYGTVVAAVEAVGVAAAALLPVGSGAGSRAVLLGLAAVYVLALLPTAVVAGGSRVPRAVAVPRPRPRVRPAGVRRIPAALVGGSPAALGGATLMFVASAPTLLAVALAAELHGRASVGLAAIAFTLGSLASPLLAARIHVRSGNGPVVWIACAVGMVAGWALAPYSVWLLCLAQVLSGLCMTALEGLLDADAVRRRPHEVTASLARATAGRAFGSAGGTAVLPLVVAAVTLPGTVGLIVCLLLAGYVAVLLRQAARAVGSHPDAHPGTHPGVHQEADLAVDAQVASRR